MKFLIRLIYYFIYREKTIIFLFLLATTSAVIFYSNPKKYFEKKTYVKIAYFEGWKNRFIKAANQVDATGVTSSIFLGDVSLLGKETKSEFRECGLMHLLAASGYNCFVVALVLSILLKLALLYPAGHISDLFAVKLKHQLELWTPIFGAWLFFLWSDHAPPISRAAVMVSAAAVTRHYGIKPSFFRFITLHVLLFIIISPSVWKSASFQLTFLALFGLCASAEVMRRFKIRNWALKAACTSIGACTFVIPVTFPAFGDINFNGVLTNFYAVPLSSVLIIPLSLFAMLALMPISSVFFPVQKMIAGYLLVLAGHATDLLLYLNVKFIVLGQWLHFTLHYVD